MFAGALELDQHKSSSPTVAEYEVGAEKPAQRQFEFDEVGSLNSTAGAKQPAHVGSGADLFDDLGLAHERDGREPRLERQKLKFSLGQAILKRIKLMHGSGGVGSIDDAQNLGPALGTTPENLAPRAEPRD